MHGKNETNNILRKLFELLIDLFFGILINYYYRTEDLSDCNIKYVRYCHYFYISLYVSSILNLLELIKRSQTSSGLQMIEFFVNVLQLIFAIGLLICYISLTKDDKCYGLETAGFYYMIYVALNIILFILLCFVFSCGKNDSG